MLFLLRIATHLSRFNAQLFRKVLLSDGVEVEEEVRMSIAFSKRLDLVQNLGARIVLFPGALRALRWHCGLKKADEVIAQA